MRAKPSPPLLWKEEGVEKTMPVATVAPVGAGDRIYSFAIPRHLVDHISPGQRVLVSLGKSGRLKEGFVVEVSPAPWNSTLKLIDSTLEEHSRLSPHLLDLGRWLARYYCCPLGRTLAAMIPEAVRSRSGYRKVRYVWLIEPLEAILHSAPRIGPAQRRLLEALNSAGGPVPADVVCERKATSVATVRTAVRRGWIAERIEKEPQPAPDCDEPIVEPPFSLNSEQREACRQMADHIAAKEFRVLLLYGVSGSGKTEVYVDAMKRAVAAGRQVILLVPEIALTTQLVHRFASRLRDVAVIHSGLSDVQRSLTWAAIRAGQKRVVIGTRSAVFAPCEDLGLIVVDEEQEAGFKNQQSPRFGARDVAIKRAQMLSIPILLGSATPALETWHNCRTHAHYSAIHLTRRVAGLEMPTVEIVDLREEERARPGSHFLSRLLEKRLGEALANHEQAVLLINRRGYAQVLTCPVCRSRVLCRNCKAQMVFHRSTGQVVCHHCYLKMPAPRACADPSCRAALVQLGLGTERVEQEMARQFPAARLRRVDSDTISKMHEYEQLVASFERREFDVMIGTQMVAKGLDFPFVSLVGVISADTALTQPDFRANERTFQLVTQVAGRAGRATARGRVVFQTLMPDLPVFRTAARHDYDAFAEAELAIRRKTQMPPFSRLTRWVLADETESAVKTVAEELAKTLREACTRLGLAETHVSGPFPSPLERVRRQYRYDVILRTARADDRLAVLDHLRTTGKLHVKVQRQIIDVDPVSML